MNDLEAVMQKVKDLTQSIIAPAAGDYDKTGQWPETSVKALAEAGLLGITVPKEFGGLGLGPSEFVRVTEEIAAACASTGMIFVMHVAATEVIKQSALPQSDSILSEIANGRHLSTLAFSERGSRSNFWAQISQARMEDGAIILNCEKSWVTSAGHATSYIVSSRAVSSSAPTESTLYYVEADTPGLEISGPWNGLGLRANASSPISIDGCRVSTDSRLSNEGDGFNVMLSVVLPWFQLGSAAVANGIGRAALTATSSHMVSARLEHLDESLASLPALRAQLARARIKLDASRALTSESAHAVDQPDETTMLKVLEVKACAGETALEVTDAAMRLCGGAAFSGHVPVERYFRDARAGAVMAPTTDVLYEFIGKALLGLPLF